MNPLKVRFHGDALWHVAAAAGEKRTLCGLPLEAGRTFSCTWKSIEPDEICRQCRVAEGSMEQES